MFDGGDSTIMVGRYPTLVPPICTFNYAFRLQSNGHGKKDAEGPKGPLNIKARGGTIVHVVVLWQGSVDLSVVTRTIPTLAHPTHVPMLV